MLLKSRPARSVAAVLAVGALGLAGCSSDDGSDAAASDATTTEAAASDTGSAAGGSDAGSEICTALQDISDFEMQSMTTLAGADPADWPALQAALTAYSAGLSEHYDPAIDVADEQTASDLTKLRDASAAATGSAAEAPSYEAFNEASTTSIDVDTAQAAIDASTRVDQYAQNTCGFAINQQQEAPAPAPAPGG